MKEYFVQYGIYSKHGAILGVEDDSFEAMDDEEAIEEALDRANAMEDYYPCVMVDSLEDEEGNELKVY